MLQRMIEEVSHSLNAELGAKYGGSKNNNVDQNADECDGGKGAQLLKTGADTGDAGDGEYSGDNCCNDKPYDGAGGDAKEVGKAGADLHEANAHGASHSAAHGEDAESVHNSLKCRGLLANGRFQNGTESQRLLCVVGSQCEWHGADGVQAVLRYRPLPHGLGDREDCCFAACTLYTCRNRRCHEVVHRFAHSPEEKTGSDTTAQRHGYPVPCLVVRGGILAADSNVAYLGEGKYYGEKYDDNSEQAEEPAEGVRHAIEQLTQQSAKSLRLENTEADKDCKQSQCRPQR